MKIGHSEKLKNEMGTLGIDGGQQVESRFLSSLERNRCVVWINTVNISLDHSLYNCTILKFFRVKCETLWDSVLRSVRRLTFTTGNQNNKVSPHSASLHLFSAASFYITFPFIQFPMLCCDNPNTTWSGFMFGLQITASVATNTAGNCHEVS